MLPTKSNLLGRCTTMIAHNLRHTMVHRHQQLGLLRLRKGRKHWARDDLALSEQLAKP